MSLCCTASASQDETSLLQNTMEFTAACRAVAPTTALPPCDDPERDILVIDQGGTGTKALYFGGVVRTSAMDDSEKIWVAKDGPPLTGADLVGYINKFLCEQQEMAQQTRCDPVLAFSFAAQTFKPGESTCEGGNPKGAWSLPPKNLPAFTSTSKITQDQIYWGCEFQSVATRIYAANDIQVAIVGGWYKVRNVQGENDVSVMTFVFGTSPNGGYATPGTKKGQLKVNGRMGYMYARIVAGADEPKIETTNSETIRQYKGYLAYKIADPAEAENNFILSLADESVFLNSIQSLDELNNLKNLPHAGSLQRKMEDKHAQWPTFARGPGTGPRGYLSTGFPFTALMRAKNTGELAKVYPNEHGFLDGGSAGGNMWRQRMTQLAYGWTHAFKDEGGQCGDAHANNRFILILGGNTVHLYGRLHDCIFEGLSAEGAMKWKNVISGKRCDGYDMDVSTYSQSGFDGNSCKIPNFGIETCKFNVVLGCPSTKGSMDGAAAGEIVQWQSTTHIAGAIALTKLQAVSEEPAFRFAPWRKAAGSMTEDTNLVFNVLG